MPCCGWANRHRKRAEPARAHAGLETGRTAGDRTIGLEVLAFVFMVVIIGGLGSIKESLESAFVVGQVVSTESDRKVQRTFTIYN